jgi:hypothetical protein
MTFAMIALSLRLTWLRTTAEPTRRPTTRPTVGAGAGKGSGAETDTGANKASGGQNCFKYTTTRDPERRLPRRMVAAKALLATIRFSDGNTSTAVLGAQFNATLAATPRDDRSARTCTHA